MKTAIKVLLTFLAIIIATPFSILFKGAPGLQLVLYAGLAAGIIAIWKYNPDKNREQKDIHHLDKTN